LVRILRADHIVAVVSAKQGVPAVARLARRNGTSSTDAQRKHARNALIKLLAQNSLTWSSDLPAILAADWLEAHPIPGTTSGSTASPVNQDGPAVNVFDLGRRIIERRVVLTPAQSTVATLWTLNTYVFDVSLCCLHAVPQGLRREHLPPTALLLFRPRQNQGWSG
jgi:hypothetical protein